MSDELDEMLKKLKDPAIAEKLKKAGVKVDSIGPKKKDRSRPDLSKLSKDMDTEALVSVLTDTLKAVLDYADGRVDDGLEYVEEKSNYAKAQSAASQEAEKVKKFLESKKDWQKLMPELEESYKKLGDIEEAYKFARVKKNLPPEDTTEGGEEEGGGEDDPPASRTRKAGTAHPDDAPPPEGGKKVAGKTIAETIKLSVQGAAKKDPTLREIMKES